MNWFIKCLNFFFPERHSAKFLMMLFYSQLLTANAIKSQETLAIQITMLLANMMSGYY